MANIKQLGMAAGTFSVALGIGFVMQNGDALASRFSNDASAPEPAPFTAEETVQVEEVSLIEVAPQQVGVSVEPQIEAPLPVTASAVSLPPSAQIVQEQETPVQLANLDPEIAPQIEEPLVQPVATTEVMDCVPEMAGVAGAGSTVKIAVTAPCHLNTAFTVHHSGMMFSAMTNEDGRATLAVPALAEVAVVIAAFENGDGAVATAVIPDFADYDRAVLQWEGDAAVILSAYENGADFGDDGHIFAGNPGDTARLSTAEGGYLVRLGDSSIENAKMVEVYTFPSGMNGVISDVMLTAEVEITASNCGQEVNAQSIQVTPTGATSAIDLTLTMPECDALGDILILQNMFQDLTLAAR